MWRIARTCMLPARQLRSSPSDDFPVHVNRCTLACACLCVAFRAHAWRWRFICVHISLIDIINVPVEIYSELERLINYLYYSCFDRSFDWSLLCKFKIRNQRVVLKSPHASTSHASRRCKDICSKPRLDQLHLCEI